jgi:hypothetical protein
MAKKGEPSGPIEIVGPNFDHLNVWIIGTNSLIINRFSKKQMIGLPGSENFDGEPAPEEAEDEGTKKKGAEKAPRNFQQDYLDSMYPLPEGGYGFPAIAFKRAIVGACRQTSQLDMTLANRIIFVEAPHVSITDGFVTECVLIHGEPHMRKDVGRNSNPQRSPRICCRAEFFPWSANLMIEFNASMVKKETIMKLIQFGGKCEGVGEQRPSAKHAPGNNGRFRLAEAGEEIPGVTGKTGKKRGKK